MTLSVTDTTDQLNATCNPCAAPGPKCMSLLWESKSPHRMLTIGLLLVMKQILLGKVLEDFRARQLVLQRFSLDRIDPNPNITCVAEHADLFRSDEHTTIAAVALLPAGFDSQRDKMRACRHEGLKDVIHHHFYFGLR
jgi:hypothetical protein